MKAALSILRGGGTLLYMLLSGGAALLRHTRGITALLGRTLLHLPLLFKNISISIDQMYGIGVESVPLVSVVALFAGGITVTQAVYQFSGLVPMKYLGVAVGKMIMLELGPVFISFVVAARVATAIAAEVGSMK
ncbi:MAG: ABC transporter permease, partial [Chitinivibrionales bacterium]|nr:ABC transporter permease [Chitinivibrionales bacterium]